MPVPLDQDPGGRPGRTRVSEREPGWRRSPKRSESISRSITWKRSIPGRRNTPRAGRPTRGPRTPGRGALTAPTHRTRSSSSSTLSLDPKDAFISRESTPHGFPPPWTARSNPGCGAPRRSTRRRRLRSHGRPPPLSPNELLPPAQLGSFESRSLQAWGQDDLLGGVGDGLGRGRAEEIGPVARAGAGKERLSRGAGPSLTTGARLPRNGLIQETST